jgi:hypothetical protein
MTCRRFKKEMLMDIYGELRDKKRRRLDAHLSRCPSCREELEMTREVLGSLDRSRPAAVPEADWERSWRTIEAGFGPSRPAPRFLAGVPRWAYASLAVAALFILGIVVGRYGLPFRARAPFAVKAGTISSAAMQTLLSRYFEDVTPVLLDYTHDGRNQGREDVLLSDRQVAASLLVQNMLLKRALSRKDPTLVDLFDDLGMILTEISNLKSQDRATPASLSDVIKERQILPRMRRLERT